MKPASLIAVLALAALTPLTVIAQGQWTVGQHVKVFYPRPGGAGPGWRTGVITEVFSWGVHMKFDDQDQVETFGNDALTAIGPAAPVAGPLPAQAAPPAPRPQAAAAAPPATGACTSDAGVTTAGGDLTAQIKHAIFENYTAEVNGGGSAPLGVGLTFQSFQIGAPLPNRVGPGGYAYPNAKPDFPVYPVTTRHTLCRQYRNATNRTLFAGKYVCFQTKFGNGIECGTAEGHKMLGYQG